MTSLKIWMDCFHICCFRISNFMESVYLSLVQLGDCGVRQQSSLFCKCCYPSIGITRVTCDNETSLGNLSPHWCEFFFLVPGRADRHTGMTKRITFCIFHADPLTPWCLFTFKYEWEYCLSLTVIVIWLFNFFLVVDCFDEGSTFGSMPLRKFHQWKFRAKNDPKSKTLVSFYF